jgi:alcohol dehydrogenase
VLANAINFPHVLAYNASARPEKTETISRLLGLSGSANAEAVLADSVAFCAALGLDLHLAHHGTKEQDLSLWAEEAFAIKRLIDNNPRPLAMSVILSIYRSAL